MATEDVTKRCRPAYEAIAAVTWFAAAIYVFLIGRYHPGAISKMGLLCIPFFYFSFYRAREAIQIWNFKSRLWSAMPVYESIQYVLAKQKRRGAVWMGKGFTWEPIHAKRIREVSALNESQTKPPSLFLALRRLLGLSAKPYSNDGHHYVHGVGDREEDVFIDNASLRGHTYIVGTTGAGKTRTFEVMIAQAIARGGPVIVLDPKGDIDLRDRCYAEARRHRKTNVFAFFSPTFPEHSIRINPLKNYSRPSQIANRIASLLPASGNSQAFRDFAWRAINVVVDGLLSAGLKPTLLNLRKYIEGDTDQLFIAATERYLSSVSMIDPAFADWESRVKGLILKTRSGLTVSLDKESSHKATAYATFYTAKVKPFYPDKTIDAMVSVMMHDRQHYNKLISNLIPLLEQLTSGPLASLLSPDKTSADPRRAHDFRRLIDRNSVVYINLDTLADGIVGQAVGSLFLADLTSVAAARYARYGHGDNLTPVSVFVDEAAEMINDAFIQNLNKGRGAGFELYIASQTIADFVAKMGDPAMAMQALGNTNTTVALRIKDPETRRFASTLFGETHYAETSEGRSSSTIDPSDNIDYRGMVTKTTQRKDLALVSEDCLGQLPNLHYFASLPGGKRIKGRVPIMPIKQEERYRPESVYDHAIPLADHLDQVSPVIQDPPPTPILEGQVPRRGPGSYPFFVEASRPNENSTSEARTG